MVNGQSQGMNPGGFSLAGAVDLEGVKRRVEAQAKQAAKAGAGSDAGSSANNSAPKAGGYVIDVNDKSFQAMVQTSVSFPIILLLWQPGDTAYYDVAQKLADAVNSLDGRMQLARIDADESPSIAQALRAEQLPAIYGLIGGRPMPISQGLPSDDELQQICSAILPQLVQVAERSGVAGTAPFVQPSEDAKDDSEESSDNNSSCENQVPAAHEKAHELAMKGDYEGAALEYAKLMDADPHDSIAAREHAKALLLARNTNTDVALVRKNAGDNPNDVDAQLAVADVDMIDGHIDDAFGRLLDFLAAGHRSDAEAIRSRMLEYFAMLPADDARLARARRRLAILLY
ncbi:tetratricopeptide repeat protein [Gardnerella sp. Marseille-QA0894]|uniref:tetratricopeptide repeat protein n=1 Tax=Gardnerella sp. Marseille-QA0894 TaxID=3383031 RepID=UPI0028044FE0|nr:tetratricopeptide repeat protein [uncultured Gardnerella sp.]